MDWQKMNQPLAVCRPSHASLLALQIKLFVSNAFSSSLKTVLYKVALTFLLY